MAALDTGSRQAFEVMERFSNDYFLANSLGSMQALHGATVCFTDFVLSLDEATEIKAEQAYAEAEAKQGSCGNVTFSLTPQTVFDKEGSVAELVLIRKPERFYQGIGSSAIGQFAGGPISVAVDEDRRRRDQRFLRQNAKGITHFSCDRSVLALHTGTIQTDFPDNILRSSQTKREELAPSLQAVARGILGIWTKTLPL